MNRPLRRSVAVLLVGLVGLIAGATWYQVLGSDRYRDHPQNPRTALALSAKQRGAIISSDGVTLAESVSATDHPREFVRRYPQGEAFTPVVGYTSPLLGDFGLEQSYVRVLRSREDLTISDLISVIMGEELGPQNLQLTLDSRLQRFAYQAMEGMRGAVVGIEPSTGAVRVLVSSPSVPTEAITGISDPNPSLRLPSVPQPPLDRATRWLYPPGSTFKTVTAVAGFESGDYSPDTSYPNQTDFVVGDQTAHPPIRNLGGGRCGTEAEVSILTAFIWSCNIPFAQLGTEIGSDRLDLTAQNLGFRESLPFDWTVASSRLGWDVAGPPDSYTLAATATGHGEIRTTPLTMALVAAAVANDGVVMSPHLVQQVFDDEGTSTDVTDPVQLNRAMSVSTAEALTQMMELVVTEGTGSGAAVAQLRVAGKTGTAPQEDHPPIVWFNGFAPVENPGLAIAVVVDPPEEVGESATGGSVAAPIGGQILAEWYRLFGAGR